MADDARQKAEDHYYAAPRSGRRRRAGARPVEYQHSGCRSVFTEALHGMARTLQDLNRLDEAIAVAKRIAELDPDDGWPTFSPSVLYQKRHDSGGRSRSQQSQDPGMEAAAERQSLVVGR
jgi:hypothetical protein